MRASLFVWAASLFATAAVAQMPTTPPGMPDPSRAKAGTYQADAAHTQILFKVNHLGFSEFYGLFPNATGTLTIDPAKPSSASVEITIPMNDIATAVPKLDEHLKAPDFFDAAKFPTATFRSTKVAVSGRTAKITGNLTVKGVTKPVTLDARFIGAGPAPMSKADTIGFAATTTVKRSDFGVSYGVPLVSDEVELNINVAFERK